MTIIIIKYYLVFMPEHLEEKQEDDLEEPIDVSLDDLKPVEDDLDEDS